ncbi:MAG: DUF5711 family protein [Eubacterium sp.]
MAGNQREMQKKEKRARRDRKNKIIVWIIIAIIVVALAAMKICEININSVKEHFTDADGNFTISQGVTKDNFPYNIDSSKNVTLKEVNKKIGILTPTSFTVLDSKDADVKYSFDHGYSNPIIKSSGIYTLIFDQGDKKMRLDTTSNNVYENEAKTSVFCADVAKNGSVVYAAASKEKKCDIYVYGKSLKEQLYYSTSDGYVVAVAINDSGNKISFVTVNSENAQLKSTLYTMSVGENEIKEKIELPLGNVIDIEYSSNNVYVIGDSFLSVIDNQKKAETVYEQGSISTVAYTFTPSNELVLVYNSYTNSTDNVIARVKPNGKIRKEGKVSGNVKAVSASSSVVSILTGNEIVSFKLSNLEETGSTAVDDSVRSICRMGTEIFVHRQSLIDRSEAEEN